MSPAAREIVAELRAAGYDAYVVGGAIRDLLLSRTPKDFDVVTNATPRQVRGIFKAARIIGRRFVVVHVRLFGELVEVSTFRSVPDTNNAAVSKTELYRREENTYGTIEDDWQRRDFSVNALYFDLKHERIIDFTDGVNDIKSRNLRCIGDPEERFSEDPCRILRAARFASKLNLQIDRLTVKAINKTKNLLHFVSPSRVADQLEKLFLLGNGNKAFTQLNDMKILPILFDSRDVIHDLSVAAMANSDLRVARGKPVTFSFLLAAMLWFRFRRATKQNNGQKQPRNDHYKHLSQAKKILLRQSKKVRVARYMREFITDTWTLQFALEQEGPKRIRPIIENDRFRAAYDFLLLRVQVGDCPQQVADWWTEFQAMDPNEQNKVIRALEPRRKRRRRRRKRRSVRRDQEVASTT